MKISYVSVQSGNELYTLDVNSPEKDVNNSWKFHTFRIYVAWFNVLPF